MTTPFDQLISFLLSVNVWSVAKLLVLSGLLLYLVFAFVIIRQVNLMSQALAGTFALPLKTIAWAHFLLAMAVFLLGLVLL